MPGCWFLLLHFWLRINGVLMRRAPVNMKFSQITHRVCSENCFRYVSATKIIFQYSEAMISIDMPVDPLEVLVISDKHENPIYIAIDFLSQAEHGPDSQVVLLLVGEGANLDEIEIELEKQCKSIPCGKFAAKALTHSFIVISCNKAEEISFSNLYAHEHLIINVEDAYQWVDYIENTGSIFLGRWSPESIRDYESGTNHVLPNYGYARTYGVVSLDSFMKYISVKSLIEEGLKSLDPHVVIERPPR
jgi:histidinol dehydrogenase